MSNPFRASVGIVERSRHLIHLCLRNQPEVVGYQFWGHRSINDAYGDAPDSGVGGAGPTALFEVQRGLGFRSPRLRQSGRGQIVGSIRGQTHAVFDPDDYAAVGAGLSPVPPDEHWMFVRVQENRNNVGLLYLPDVPEATVTLNGVLAGDQLTVKGVFFEFQAGANNLAGKAGTALDPFLVGLGASDDDAAANLTTALNDAGDVAPVMDALAPLNGHTFATNVGAPSAVVLIQPEGLSGDLWRGSPGEFAITSSDGVRIVIDVAALAAGTLVWVVDTASPALGAICCIPPAIFFGTRNPSFTVEGTAPSGTSCEVGRVPISDEAVSSGVARPLHLVFPLRVTEMTVHNISGVAILVAFGAGQPMLSVAAGQTAALTSGNAGAKEVFLACPTGVAGAAFTLHAVTRTEMEA